MPCRSWSFETAVSPARHGGPIVERAVSVGLGGDTRLRRLGGGQCSNGGSVRTVIRTGGTERDIASVSEEDPECRDEQQ
jgi:hypothetical protein